jgi:hypothetical protein
MRPRITYVAGYGWHVGRVFVWPTLLLGSLLSVFVSVPLELGLQAWSETQLPFGLLVPLTSLVVLLRRLRRKLAHEPFVVDGLFDDAYRLDLVHREQQPQRFWKLFRLEVWTWGGAVVLQTAMLMLWYWQD